MPCPPSAAPPSPPAQVPQLNDNTQQLAIESLAAYSFHSRFFLAVSPEARHHDSGEAASLRTYSQRGWCRLEQWARICQSDERGTKGMYLWDGRLRDYAELDTGGRSSTFSERASDDDDDGDSDDDGSQALGCVLREAALVFEGQFAFAADRLRLVDPILGMWATILSRSAETSPLIRFVFANYERVFPDTYMRGSSGVNLASLLRTLLDARRASDGASATDGGGGGGDGTIVLYDHPDAFDVSAAAKTLSRARDFMLLSLGASSPGSPASRKSGSPASRKSGSPRSSRKSKDTGQPLMTQCHI